MKGLLVIVRIIEGNDILKDTIRKDRMICGSTKRLLYYKQFIDLVFKCGTFYGIHGQIIMMR